MSASPRHRARELTLQALYATEHCELPPEENLEKILDEEKLAERHLDFARHLFNLVLSEKDWADEIISSLSRNWSLERIASIDRTIMRIALVELEKMPDVPVKVVLNEAIELAKTFSTSESSSFINGILDEYVKKMDKTGSTG